MPLSVRAIATLALILAAQQAAFAECEDIRVRVEVRPQASQVGELVTVQIIPRPNGELVGSALLMFEDGYWHLRFDSGAALRCDGTIMIAADADATFTSPGKPIVRAERKLPLLIVAEDVEGEAQEIDILLGGGQDALRWTAIGEIQVIAPRGR